MVSIVYKNPLLNFGSLLYTIFIGSSRSGSNGRTHNKDALWGSWAFGGCCFLQKLLAYSDKHHHPKSFEVGDVIDSMEIWITLSGGSHLRLSIGNCTIWKSDCNWAFGPLPILQLIGPQFKIASTFNVYESMNSKWFSILCITQAQVIFRRELM